MKINWVLGLVVINMIFFTCIASAESNGTSSDVQPSWSGKWQSLLYIETLIQNETSVTGTYIPIESTLNDNGIINGTITNNGSILEGTWTEKGDIKINILNDTTLDGLWTYSDEPQLFSKIDDINDIAGTWSSNSLALNLQKNGYEVTGAYESIDNETGVSGIINTTISSDGKQLTGSFNESGKLLFILSDDGSYINGTYTYGDKSQKDVDTWNATRVE